MQDQHVQIHRVFVDWQPHSEIPSVTWNLRRRRNTKRVGRNLTRRVCAGCVPWRRRAALRATDDAAVGQQRATTEGEGAAARRGGGGTRGRDAVAKESPGPGGCLVQGSGEALQVPPGATLPLADQKSQLQESPVTRGPPPCGPSLCPGLTRTPSPAKRRIPSTSGPPPGAAPMGGAALQGSWWELASLDTPLGERGPAGRPGTRKARAAPCWEVFGQSPLADLRSAPSWGCHHICRWAGSGKALRPALVSRGCELAHSMHLSPPGLKP